MDVELFGVPRPDLARKYSFVMLCKKKNPSSFKPDMNSTLKAAKKLRLKTFPEKSYERFCEKAKLSDDDKCDLFDLIAEILSRGFEVAEDDAEPTSRRAVPPSVAGGFRRDFGEAVTLLDNSSLAVSTITAIENHVQPEPSASASSADEEKGLNTDADLDSKQEQSEAVVEDDKVHKGRKKIKAKDYLSLIFAPYYLDALNGSVSSYDDE